MAAGTRTAPTIDGAPSTKLISMSFVDVVGDIRTESYRVDGLSTDLQIEAIIAALAAGSTASLFQVKVQAIYAGARTKQNATADGRSSADDKMRITLANVSQGTSKRFYVPAPVAELFEVNSENINIQDATFTNLTTAIDAVEPPAWSFSTVGFVEHQESNEPQTL